MFDRKLLTKDLGDAAETVVTSDSRPLTFTHGFVKYVGSAFRVLGEHVANAHDHHEARLKGVVAQVDKIEQRLSALQKSLAALERKAKEDS